MTEPNPLEDLKRTIVLVYGLLANGNPFWAFAAVKTNRYQLFLADQKEGKIDLSEFDSYGEIVISGEGKSPPDDITLKVAEMYQNDPITFAKNVQEDISDMLPKLGELNNNG